MMDLKVKVLGLIVNENGQVLLLKEKVPERDRPLWNAIRGTYDNGTESLEETVIRECSEEASAEVIIKKKLPYHFEHSDPTKIRVYFPFVCDLKKTGTKIHGKDFQEKLNEEIIELRWFSGTDLEMISEDDFMEPFIYKIIKDAMN